MRLENHRLPLDSTDAPCFPSCVAAALSPLSVICLCLFLILCSEVSEISFDSPATCRSGDQLSAGHFRKISPGYL